MKKIALVHDFLVYYGGAEKTLITIDSLFPDAPVFVLLKERKIAERYFPNKKVQTSFLGKWPRFFQKHHKFLLPFMPTAIETFNLRQFDLVISSSSAFAKGIVLKPKTKHVCYMHCPMRYVWDWNHEYMQERKLKGKARLFTRMFLSYLRIWDRASAERVDFFVANSNFTAQRIKKYYRRESHVIYPPVDVKKFSPTKENAGYFLTVGRLSEYKRVRLIVRVFQKMKLPLVIVGEGRQKKELEEIAKKSPLIKVLGWVPEEKLPKLYENAKAFVCASEDDFNITAVEAMAAGKPVIALRKGGVTETVEEGITGEFFDEPVSEKLAECIRRFNEKERSYDFERIRLQAEKFSEERFKREFEEYINRL